MSLPKVFVVSTGWKHPTAALCRSSVKSQRDVEVEHVYIEASEQRPPRTKMENLREAIGKLPPDAVVALVDGDDWLAHRRALARIAEAHARGMWVTYGSFATSDGQKGFAAPYGPHEDYRSSPWRATHLKTFRAGLFGKIRQFDLEFRDLARERTRRFAVAGETGVPEDELPPSWIDRGDDPAFMWPIMEMSGRDRVLYIPDVLYAYNYAEAWETKASPAERLHEKELVTLVRGRPPYPRLDNLGDEARVATEGPQAIAPRPELP